MDIATLLEVIRMLDQRINLKPHEFTTMSDGKWIEAFRDHLQSCIDSQVSSMEVSLSGGE